MAIETIILRGNPEKYKLRAHAQTVKPGMVVFDNNGATAYPADSFTNGHLLLVVLEDPKGTGGVDATYATGTEVRCAALQSGCAFNLIASEAVARGSRVKPDNATGKVEGGLDADAGKNLGVALGAAAGNNSYFPVRV